MKNLILLVLSFAAAARADFSYTATLKSAAPQVTKYSIKGQNFSTAPIPDSTFGVPSDYKPNQNMH